MSILPFTAGIRRRESGRGLRLGAAGLDLTLVVPAFNEARRLPHSLRTLRDFLDAWCIDYGVLVVDDGSRDDTAAVTDGFGPRFSTRSLPVNRGKGAAVREGMLHAPGRVVAFMDADLPYRLDCLPAAYKSVASGRAEAVFGARDVAGAGSRVRRSFMRAAASFVFRRLVRLLISRDVTDAQAGFKMFGRSAARRIFGRATIDGFAFDSEVVLLAHRLEIRYERLPVVLVNEDASTVSLTRHALPMLADLARIRFRDWRGAYRFRGRPRLTGSPAGASARFAA